MKKFIVVLAVFAGLASTAAFANNTCIPQETTEIQVELQYETIDAEALPQAIKDAIEANYKDQTIKSAAVATAEDGSKTYKVTMTTTDGTETEVLFNENGEVQPS